MRTLYVGAALALATSAGAQIQSSVPIQTSGPHAVCTLPVVAGEAVRSHAARRGGDHCTRDGGDFEVTYRGFAPEAERAFQAAIDAWSCQLDVDVPIRIEATWEPLGAGTLGSAGPLVIRNFEGAPSPEVWYPAALADQFAGENLTDAPDIEASFNSSFPDWHFDPNTPPENGYDLFTVVLHEIAHGLGFIGALRVEDGRGVIGENGPYAYDLQTSDGTGTSLLDSRVYPLGSARLANALTETVVFSGRAAEAARLAPIKLYAPSGWLPGGSYSHLDEDEYPSGTPDGALSPFISRGEAVGGPGPATCAVLADIGWAVERECADAVGAPGVPASGLVLSLRGPNPVRSETRLEIASEVSRLVEVEVRDARGRRVLDLGTSALVAGRPFTVEVDARDLASGAYFLVVRGGPDLRVMPIAVARG